MTPRPSLLALVVAGLLFVGSPVWPVVAVAQDIKFEEVGGIPLDANDIEFASDGALWALTSELYRLGPASGTWEEIYDGAGGLGKHLIVLSPDTLLRGTTSGQHRSTDGGQSWVNVFSEGGAPFAASLSGPNHGVVLSGEDGGGTGIAYSIDRGASFTDATFTVSTSSRPFLNDALEIPDGPSTGRLVAGVFNGIVVSEDSGQTWEPSSLFQNGQFDARGLEIGADHLTGNRKLFATVVDSQEPGGQLYASEDDGLTWTYVSMLAQPFLLEASPAPPTGNGLFWDYHWRRCSIPKQRQWTKLASGWPDAY